MNVHGDNSSEKILDLIEVERFEASGVFTVPENGKYLVLLVGGGASGSGTNRNKAGGSSGHIEKVLTLVANENISVTVGKGGARVVNGEAGGSSFFGTYFSAIGANVGLSVNGGGTPSSDEISGRYEIPQHIHMALSDKYPSLEKVHYGCSQKNTEYQDGMVGAGFGGRGGFRMAGGSDSDMRGKGYGSGGGIDTYPSEGLNTLYGGTGHDGVCIIFKEQE